MKKKVKIKSALIFFLVINILVLNTGYTTYGASGFDVEFYEEQEVLEDNVLNAYHQGELDSDAPVYQSNLRTISLLPSFYQIDIAELIKKYPYTRNQNPYGTCWAFSSIGLAEFDLINDKKYDSSINLSELQLAYFSYNFVQDPLGGTEGDIAKYYNENTNTSYLNYGGNYEMAVRRFAQWIGPVKEEIVSYNQAELSINSGIDEKYAYEYDIAHLHNAYRISIKNNINDVKLQIMEHGAAGIMYYHDDNSLMWNSELKKYTYYDTDYSGGGHAVMIVGWDDNFSKDNFGVTSKPQNDGAWLIRNSWGTYCNYFWMSYESASIMDSAWIFDFEVDDGLDNNYQLDGGIASYPDKQHLTYANVFNVQEKNGVLSETLKSVSLSFQRETNVTYTIEVYTDLTNKNNPLSGTKQEQCTTYGSTSYAGIYSIPLNQSIEIRPGTTFAIIVKTDKAALDYEQASSIEDFDSNKIIWESKVSYYNNKSFYLSGGRYYPYLWGNYCVKAFTSNNMAKEDTLTQEMEQLAKENKDVLADGVYEVRSAVDTKYVLDVYCASKEDGANVQLYESNGTEAQRWKIEHDEKGYITIISERSGKVLDVDCGNTTNGTNVRQYTSNNTKAQKWIAVKNEDGTIELISALNKGICLNISGGNVCNGANVEIYETNKTSTQKWIFEEYNEMEQLAKENKDVLADGVYEVRSAVDTKYVLDVYCASKEDGANVQLYESNGTEAQRWKIEHDEKGYITIISERSGKVLDVDCGSMTNGTNVRQYTSNNTKAQKWIAVKNEDGTIELISALNKGICLNISGGNVCNGANVEIYETNKTSTQKWIFEEYN